jgi:hypothetical protein
MTGILRVDDDDARPSTGQREREVGADEAEAARDQTTVPGECVRAERFQRQGA